MKFVGLDLGGVNSLACVRNHTGTEAIQGSTHTERPSCVLLPLVRKERLLAGDEALRNERGAGLPWPPLAMAEQDGWSRAIPPASGGRLLLATVWQRLVAGGQWQEPQWQPPDGLPALNKPTPAECLAAEVLTVLKQVTGDASSAQVALAIPNQLPEESQEFLLHKLPEGTRLVWRSVAAAMSWAEVNASRIAMGKYLAVLDAGLHGIEISVFEFRRQEVDGKVFHMPVRRIERLHPIETNTLFTDRPAPFTRLHPELTRLEQHLGQISNAIGVLADLLACGPMAGPLLDLVKQRFPRIEWPSPDASAVARGSCLFAWRLAQGWPTYLDVLPSLELFTLTEEHEPNWLPLIPAECEVSGGRDFQHTYPRRIFIEKDTTRLASWLQRSGETEFRKLLTNLPIQAARDAKVDLTVYARSAGGTTLLPPKKGFYVDLTVYARSAGGFARVRITPSQGEFDVFGVGETVLLNWQNMERVARKPAEKWPKGMVSFGWPACGSLYAHQRFFDEFLESVSDLEQVVDLPDAMQRITRLALVKKCVQQTIAPHLAGAPADAAPVNLLLCFSTEIPCRFMESRYSGVPEGSEASQSKHARAGKVSEILWRRLHKLAASPYRNTKEINALIYILGRMAGYAPESFRDYIANNISTAVRQFAAGRVLRTAEHGRLLFAALENRDNCNNNWLRLLVYVLYQNPDVLRDVPREHVAAVAVLCVNVLDNEVRQRRVKIRFMNSLRALALLLRVRRHVQSRDFLCPETCPSDEADLAKRFNGVLCQAKSLLLRRGPHQTLLERVTEWLEVKASTDEMPPIAPPGEENEAEETNDE